MKFIGESVGCNNFQGESMNFIDFIENQWHSLIFIEKLMDPIDSHWESMEFIEKSMDSIDSQWESKKRNLLIVYRSAK